MADPNWLSFGTNGNGSNAGNEFEVSNTLPLPHPDHSDQDATASGVDKSSERSTTRRKMFLGLAVLMVVIAAAVAVPLVLRSPAKQPSSSMNSSGSGGADSTEEEKKDNTDSTPAGEPDANSPIAKIIQGIARNGGKEFQDANSYQSRAKQWVLTQAFPVNDGSKMTTEQQATQLYALACLYYATYSVRSDWTDVHYGADLALPGWYSNRGWLGSADDICNWHGLACDDQGRIRKIELDTNGLTGAFPSEVALLHETLTTIDLYNNMVHNVGDEGNSFLGELTNLEHLYLGTTNFEYAGIPSVLGKLTALKELDVSHSLYFGKLDGATFTKLSNLRYLAMDGNSYNSPLPSELVQLPSLEFLYAGFSFLEDNIDFVSDMPKIRELWVDDNPGLKGTIPSSFPDSLASFSASNCGVTGPIPTEIGSLNNMVQLWLNDNELTGEIPSEIGNLVTLEILNVQGNNLVGDMSSSICNRRRPFGRLEELGADCDGAITCSEQCCTCCGDQCASR